MFFSSSQTHPSPSLNYIQLAISDKFYIHLARALTIIKKTNTHLSISLSMFFRNRLPIELYTSGTAVLAKDRSWICDRCYNVSISRLIFIILSL